MGYLGDVAEGFRVEYYGEIILNGESRVLKKVDTVANLNFSRFEGQKLSKNRLKKMSFLIYCLRGVAKAN